MAGLHLKKRKTGVLKAISFIPAGNVGKSMLVLRSLFIYLLESNINMFVLDVRKGWG
jgi:hypothetical protein